MVLALNTSLASHREALSGSLMTITAFLMIWPSVWVITAAKRHADGRWRSSGRGGTAFSQREHLVTALHGHCRQRCTLG